jgi:hypothetical protein
MRKTVLPLAWDMRDEIVVPLPVCRDGHMAANDAGRFAKRAGEAAAAAFRELEFGPGEIPIHLLAVGCTEMFGANRNGDGFRKSACRQFHDTFVKRARFYRDHRSDKPEVSYGLVKWSGFNEPMGRIELIVALNGTADTARRNNGRIADQEMEKLASHKPFGVSMGCEVEYDVCSACGHRARNRTEYCDRECVGGGLVEKMGRVVDLDGDLHQLHADNPEPSWHDISGVGRNADRIALVTGVLSKTAGDVGVQLGGAELAELLAPAPGLGRWAKLARELAIADRNVERQADIAPGLYYDHVTLPVPPTAEFGQITAALADAHVVLPITKFAELFTQGRPVANGHLLQHAARGIFARLDDIADNPFQAATPTTAMRAWAHKVAATYSVAPQAIRRRYVDRGLLAPQLLPTTKTAAASPLVDEVARAYGMYVLAAAERLDTRDENYPLTVTAALLQNRLI